MFYVETGILTVEATAAGTLKMTLMIGFKLKHMNTVAMKFAMKLKTQIVSVPIPTKPQTPGTGRYSRNQKENQTILEQHVYDLRATFLTKKPRSGKNQDNQIETHGINECGC